MNYWLWSVDSENWPIIKEKLVWGFRRKKNNEQFQIGDHLIFYVKSTGSFKGIFKTISKYQDYGSDLTDVNGEELFKNFPVRCTLEKILEGDAVFNELSPKLECTSPYPIAPQIVLRNTTYGAANSGHHLSQHDYDLIFKSMSEQIILPTDKIILEDDFDHEEAITKLEEIAEILGFESHREYEYTHVAKGSVVDLVWETKIANIGIIQYVFEVQSKGSQKSLIDNLIRSMNNPNVKKVIAVSDEIQLTEIKQHVETTKVYSQTAKNMFVFLNNKLIDEFHQQLPKINALREKFSD